MAEYKLRYRFLGALAAGVFALAPCTALLAAAPQADVGGDPVTGLIVKFNPPSPTSPLVAFSAAARAQWVGQSLAAYGRTLRYTRELGTGAELLSLDKPVSYADAVAMATEVSRVAGVKYAAPNRTIRPQVMPTDPLFSDAGQWGFKYVPGSIEGANFTGAWDITRGSASQTIGIIDSGIARQHVELQKLRTHPNFPFGGYDFITDVETAGDGDGRDNNPQQFEQGAEACGHGTHVAGTIAADTSFFGPGTGVAGGATDSTLLIGRAFRQFGADSDAIDAMLWMSGVAVPGLAVNTNIPRMINMSFGGLGACGAAYQDAIDTLVSRGVLAVTAAGNSGVDVSQFAPANCRGTLAVAAVNIGGSRASFSNFGAHVAIAAPGVNILSTGGTSEGSCYKDGTSMAAPHVTATTALMQAVLPSLTVNQTLLGIRAGARPFPSGSSCNTSICGAGLLDAYQSVNAVSSTVVRVGWNESSVSIRENDGNVVLTLSRIGSASVAASATVNAVSGTAVLGLDFSAATPSTVSWAAGDVTDRTITVPILYRSGEQGVREFTVALGNPGSGTSFVAPAAIPVRINEVDCDSVTAIAMSETKTGSLNTATPASFCHGGVRGPEYNTVRYSFSGTAGDVVWVSARSTTPTPDILDPYIYLLNPDRTILAENDDMANTVIRDSAIQQVTLTNTGTHYIDVTTWSASQDATGSFQVRLSNCGPYIPQAICNADANGDDRVDTRDALYVVRRLLGVSDAALLAGTAPVACATRGTGALTSAFIDTQVTAPSGPVAYDIDGDGQVRPFTDGLMLLRIALGLTGDAVVTGAVAPGAPRNTWALIKPYLRESCGLPLAP